MLGEEHFSLTTRAAVDARKVEMARLYVDADKFQRFTYHNDWRDSTIRFRKKIWVQCSIEARGSAAREALRDVNTVSLSIKVTEEARSVLMKAGFEIGGSEEMNMADITAWVIDVGIFPQNYIIDGNLSYKRDLLDQTTGWTYMATMHEQRSIELTADRKKIEALIKDRCLRSVEGFIQQMRDDETTMQAYHELRTEGKLRVPELKGSN